MVAIELEYGYGNSAKGGRELPLTLSLKNEEQTELKGTLEILTRQSDGECYAYEYPLELAAAETHRAQYVVPIGVGSDQLVLLIKNEAGELVSESSHTLNINVATPELFIGILSDRPEALSYLDRASVNYGQLRTHSYVLAGDSFPSERRQLDSFDVIVVNGYRLSRLDVEQMRALMQWMRDGGVLMLGTGERVNDTLGIIAPEFLDDIYESPEELTLNLSELQEADAPGAEELTLPLVHFSLHGGTVLFSSDSEPLITAANKGKGALAVASFDFSDISSYAETHSSFTDMLLTKTLGSTRLDRLASEAYGTEHDEYWSAQSLIDSGSPGLLPNLGVYGAVLGLYLLCVGPLLYLTLRKHSLELYYRRIVPVLALGFAAVIFALSSATRFEDSFYSYARICEAGEDAVNETSYLNLRNPYSSSYSVQIRDGSELSPLTTALNQKQLRAEGGEADVIIREQGKSRELTVNSTEPFRSHFFKIRSGRANQEGIGFSGELSVFGDDCTGEVTNHFPFAVSNAAVVLYGKIIPLGSMKEGESINVSERTLYHIPLNDSATVAAFLSGVYDGAAGQDARLRALERANFLAFYLSDTTTSYSADARIIAFSESADGESPVLDAGLKNFGMTLVTSTISVNNERDGSICRSALIRTPEVLSGDYIAVTNSYYRGDPVVLGYLLGSSFKVEELVLEEPDALFEHTDGESGAHSFRGSISFYNYENGNFEDIESGKRSFRASELRHYLSPDNMITVRYAEGTDSAAGRLDTALPMLTVIGEEE